MNLILGDCREKLTDIESNSVDSIVTDPPYGIAFMGKDWDRIKFDEFFTPIWKECLRVLKHGGFAFVMCSPRADVMAKQISRLSDVGFEVGFTPIFWLYKSGFPKAMNISKAVDKKLGIERISLGKHPNARKTSGRIQICKKDGDGQLRPIPATPQAKSLDGSYGGFQPKPAIEVILVAMNPLSEKSYVDQALKNRKGITWLDDGRIPYPIVNGKEELPSDAWYSKETGGIYRKEFEQNSLYHTQKVGKQWKDNLKGRFPANFLVSGIKAKFKKYFDLDKWHQVFELSDSLVLDVPKPSKSEKDKGCENIDARVQKTTGKGIDSTVRRCPTHNEPIPSGYPTYKCGCKIEHHSEDFDRPKKNFHPTCKPVDLMKYLIIIGSREGDTILDPFMGSGTTGIACRQTNRKFIGIELKEEYFEIAKARINNIPPNIKSFKTPSKEIKI